MIGSEVSRIRQILLHLWAPLADTKTTARKNQSRLRAFYFYTKICNSWPLTKSHLHTKLQLILRKNESSHLGKLRKISY